MGTCACARAHTHRSFLYHPHGAPTTSEGRTQVPRFHTRPGPAPQTGPAASSCAAAALVTGLLLGSELHGQCLSGRQGLQAACSQGLIPQGPWSVPVGVKGRPDGVGPSTHTPQPLACPGPHTGSLASCSLTQHLPCPDHHVLFLPS